MASISPSALSIPRLRQQLRGQVVAPDDERYDEARTVFPPDVDRRPAVIVRPADAGEVAHVVALARETGARAGRSRRRSQPRRPRRQRGRDRPRSRLAEGHRDRSRAMARLGGDKADGRRVHDRGGSPRARGRLRRHRLGRDRRAHPRRRRRLPRPQARAHDRRPHGGRARHGRRPDPLDRRGAAPRPLLGDSRRRRPSASPLASSTGSTSWTRSTAGCSSSPRRRR